MYPVRCLVVAVFAVGLAASLEGCPPDYLEAMKKCDAPVKNKIISGMRNCRLLHASTSCELDVIERCRDQVMVDFRMSSQDYAMVVASMREMVEGTPEECKSNK